MTLRIDNGAVCHILSCMNWIYLYLVNKQLSTWPLLGLSLFVLISFSNVLNVPIKCYGLLHMLHFLRIKPSVNIFNVNLKMPPMKRKLDLKDSHQQSMLSYLPSKRLKTNDKNMEK